MVDKTYKSLPFYYGVGSRYLGVCYIQSTEVIVDITYVGNIIMY